MSDSSVQYNNVAAQLAAPFPAHDIEWRVQSSGKKSNGEIWAKVLAYVTARAIMERLDLVFGPFGWQDAYSPGPAGGVVCKLSVLDGERWVTKEDGADNTDIEGTKGGISSALKRAAVKWGVGRYLYRLDEGWAIITPNGEHSGKTKDGDWFKWSAPAMPPWCNPDAGAAAILTFAPRQASPAPAMVQSRPATATQSTPAASPVESVKVVNAPASNSAWRSVNVPPFIKKYAAQTLGDMAEQDLQWWAKNYEPRPYKGTISPKDVMFKAALVTGATELAAQAEAGVQQDAHNPSRAKYTDAQMANTSGDSAPADVPF